MAKGAYIGVSEFEIYVDTVMVFETSAWVVGNKDDLPLVSGEELLVHVNVNGTVYRDVMLEENLFGGWEGTSISGEISLTINDIGFLDLIDNTGMLDESLSYPIKIYSETENIARKIKKGYIGVGNVIFEGESEYWYDSEYDVCEYYFGRIPSFPNPDKTYTIKVNGTTYPNCAANFNPAEGICLFNDDIEIMIYYADGGYDWIGDVYIIDRNGSFEVGSSLRLKIIEGNEVARKIKKVYIGIGGVARPCWSGGELTYYGTITALSKARSWLSATTVGDYAIFAGGNGYPHGRAVDAYDPSLTRTTLADLTYPAIDSGAATVGNYALFAGGNGYWSGANYDTHNLSRSTVYAFDTSLVRTIATSLGTSRGGVRGATIGNYALFAGGINDSNVDLTNVDVYDSSLTRSNNTLGAAASSVAATTVGNHALFAGGGYIYYRNRVDTFDTSLTRGTATQLSVARTRGAATTVGNYTLVAGGTTDISPSYVSAVVDSYDTSLTKGLAPSLSAEIDELAATTVGNYALFGGGDDGGREYYAIVDAYDASLTHTVSHELSTSKSMLAATAVGNYALFGGGRDYNDVYADVDVYTIA